MKKNFLVVALIFFTSSSSLLCFDSLFSTSLIEQCPTDAASCLVNSLITCAVTAITYKIGNNFPFTNFYKKEVQLAINRDMKCDRLNPGRDSLVIGCLSSGYLGAAVALFFSGKEEMAHSFSFGAFILSYMDGSFHYLVRRQKELKKKT